MDTFQDAIYALLEACRETHVDDDELEIIPRRAFNERINVPENMRTLVTDDLVGNAEKKLRYAYLPEESDNDNLVFKNLMHK